MKVTIESAADGRRLAKAMFRPEVPNPAQQAGVEAVFEVMRVEAANLEGEPYAVIGPLSCTLADTREAYTMSREQRGAVVMECLIKVAEEDGLGWA